MLLLFVNQGVGGGGGYARAFTDLTTYYVAHLAVLAAANSGKDLGTLASKDLATIHGAVSAGNQDDLNTAIAEYLLTNN